MVDTLRVTTWKDFVGQEKLKKRLDVHIRAAVAEPRTLEHILLVGPPGFGKTSLATIIANRLKVDLTEFTMPIDERTFITMVHNTSGVVLLDEIHRLPPRQQESLFPLLEFGWISDKKGRKFASHNLTVVAATTEPEKVIPPLYDRFPIRPDFEDYVDEEMAKIVTSMAGKAHVTISVETAIRLGRATGGTPRRARQFVLAAKDLHLTEGNEPTADDVLELCQVDETGISAQHRAYILAMEKMNGLAGLKTLQNMLRLNETIVRDLERLLVKQNLIIYTERGRELTSEGYVKAKQLK